MVPLLVREPNSGPAQRIYELDPVVGVWMFTPTEIRSALARRRTARKVPPAEMAAVRTRLQALEQDWSELREAEEVRVEAHRLLSVHPLRSGDVLQLAAARIMARAEREPLPFVTFDDELADAARAEGFEVIGASARRGA